MVVLSCLPFCHPAERHKPLPASRATWQHSWPKLSFNVHAARQLFPGFGAVGDCSVLSNIRCVYTTQTGSTLYGYHYHWPQLVKTKLHCYTLKHALLRIDQLPRQRQSINPSIVNGRLPFWEDHKTDQFWFFRKCCVTPKHGFANHESIVVTSLLPASTYS